MKTVQLLVPIGMSLLFASFGLAQGTVRDASLSVGVFASGLSNPTGFVFLPGSSDAFVIEKDTGRVQLISNRAVASTALDLPVANDSERGLLGIALHPQFTANGFVYLYHSSATADGGPIISNRVDRYVWNGSQLLFNRRILNLPGTPGPNHNGGRILFGPDGKLYGVIGDLNRRERTQNVTTSRQLSLSSVVFRVNDDGSVPRDNPFFSAAYRGRNRLLNRIYAYGVRNSFGLRFEPKTKRLWDSEAGVNTFDELNEVNPGFNSGWVQIMGPRSRNRGQALDLVDLGPRARYADPKFSWRQVITPTALDFVQDVALGSKYQRDLLVGDYEGNLYDFDLSRNRRSLLLTGALRDGVADSPAELNSVLLGSSFGVVTDLQARPDGLFVLSLDQGQLYRVSLTSLPGAMDPALISSSAPVGVVPEPGSILLVVAAVIGLTVRGRRSQQKAQNR